MCYHVGRKGTKNNLMDFKVRLFSGYRFRVFYIFSVSTVDDALKMGVQAAKEFNKLHKVRKRNKVNGVTCDDKFRIVK